MIALVQRTLNSRVLVNNKVTGSIKKGLLVFLGISCNDTENEIKYLAEKIINLRIFDDENHKMNLSNKDINGEFLIISQFTLYGNCNKGRRPSYEKAMKGEKAELIYNKFVQYFKNNDHKTETGVFGADMKVEITNDGPVTIIVKSKNEII